MTGKAMIPLLLFRRYSASGPPQDTAWVVPSDIGMPVLDAVECVVRTLQNVKYGSPDYGRWLRGTPHEHVYAAIGHIASHLRGRVDEDHIAHAAARLLLAIARTTAP